MMNKLSLLAASAALAITFGVGAAHATDPTVYYDYSDAWTDGAGFSGGTVWSTPHASVTGAGSGSYQGNANASTGSASASVNTGGAAGVTLDANGGAAWGEATGGGYGDYSHAYNETWTSNGNTWNHTDADASNQSYASGTVVGNATGGAVASSGAGSAATSNSKGTTASANSNGSSTSGVSSSGGGAGSVGSSGGGASSSSASKGSF